MKHGFIKTAAMTPRIRVADPEYNAKEVCRGIGEACAKGARIIVFPELCLTGYTCGDLFLQELLLNKAADALRTAAEATEGSDALVFVGLPLEKDGKLYDVAAVLQNGEVLAFIPKSLSRPTLSFMRQGILRRDAERSGSIFSTVRKCPSGSIFCLRWMRRAVFW